MLNDTKDYKVTSDIKGYTVRAKDGAGSFKFRPFNCNLMDAYRGMANAYCEHFRAYRDEVGKHHSLITQEQL